MSLVKNLHICSGMPASYKFYINTKEKALYAYVGDYKSNPLIINIKYCPYCGQSVDVIALGLITERCVWVREVGHWTDGGFQKERYVCDGYEVYDHWIEGATQCRVKTHSTK